MQEVGTINSLLGILTEALSSSVHVFVLIGFSHLDTHWGRLGRGNHSWVNSSIILTHRKVCGSIFLTNVRGPSLCRRCRPWADGAGCIKGQNKEALERKQCSSIVSASVSLSSSGFAFLHQQLFMMVYELYAIFSSFRCFHSLCFS